MNQAKVYTQEVFSGERSLFGEENATVIDTVFHDGESPLKESKNIVLINSMFKWKYPLWYANNISATGCTWFEQARAGVWYSNDVTLTDCAVEAPKNFRRCKNLVFDRVSMLNAAETLWHCDGATLKNVTAKGDYFAMNSKNLVIDGLTLYGNYSFDGVENVEIRRSKLITKDAFWNSNNVTVYDSVITGEYLGWNAKNLTLINCTVESLQGMCYIDNLVMKNCKLINTTLAFEYSTVDADIDSRIDSVLNPSGGTVKAKSIGELILEKDKVDITKTKIICKEQK